MNNMASCKILAKMIETFEPIVFSHITNKGIELEFKSNQIHALYVTGVELGKSHYLLCIIGSK
jgi:hypothetical protein